MPAQRFRVPQAHLAAHVAQRLGGGKARDVVWEDRGTSVAVYGSELKIRVLDGWLVVSVPMATDDIDKTPITLPFALGSESTGGGLRAVTTRNTQDATGLSARWASSMATAVWEGVLDAFHEAIQSAKPTGLWRIQSFFAAEDAVLFTLVSGGAK